MRGGRKVPAGFHFKKSKKFMKTSRAQSLQCQPRSFCHDKEWRWAERSVFISPERIVRLLDNREIRRAVLKLLQQTEPSLQDRGEGCSFFCFLSVKGVYRAWQRQKKKEDVKNPKELCSRTGRNSARVSMLDGEIASVCTEEKNATVLIIQDFWEDETRRKEGERKSWQVSVAVK